MELAVLTPSRGRPEKLYRMIKSAAKRSSKATFYVYVDEDDDRIPTYQKIDNITLIIGPRVSISKSWNVLADKAYKDGKDVFIMGNDDVIYQTDNWDSILIEHIKNYPHNYYCMWFKDGIKNERHCTFPIVSKYWFELLDYKFTPGIFNHQFNDTWLFDIAKRAGVCHYIQEVYTPHIHPSYYPQERDATYDNLVDNSFLQKDRIIFNETEQLRIELAERLLVKIRESSNI